MNSKVVFNSTGEKLGEFLLDCAGFQINSLNLPTQWDYIYQNRDILLKVDQFGPVYAQAEPPGDIMIFKRENGQRFSNWAVWLSSKQIDHGLPFNNFFRPIIDGRNPSKQPDNLKVVYRPECATYEFLHEGYPMKPKIKL